MKNLFATLLVFIALSQYCFAQPPSSGLILWLKSDAGLYKDALNTYANTNDLIYKWADQSGNANDFVQGTLTQRPLLKQNVFCGKPAVYFDINRRTFLQGAVKLSGTKSVFIVYLLPPFTSAAQTLLSVKTNAGEFSEVVCTDFSGYKPLCFISDLPSSPTGGYMVPASGINGTFSTTGNLISVCYNGSTITNCSSYDAMYDLSQAGVSNTGLFGRLPNDESTIGARAPQQNLNFLTGYIAEILVYNRVVSNVERDAINAYLVMKYGLYGNCSVLPVHFSCFSVKSQNRQAAISWNDEELASKEYTVQRSANAVQWFDIDSVSANRTGRYSIVDHRPIEGINYYRICAVSRDGEKHMSEIRKLDFSSEKKLVIIYPNPASDYFFTDAKDVRSITLYDAAGNRIKEVKCDNSKILIGDLPGGFYSVCIRTGEKLFWQKLLKK